MAEKPTEALPVCAPIDIDTRWLPAPPCTARHRNDVSDSQDDPSLVECPILPQPENDVRPAPVPCTVMLAEPLAATLHWCTMLSCAKATDSPADALPDLVIDVRLA